LPAASGGTALVNAPHTPEVDLAEMGQAYLLASFQPPAGVEDVEFAERKHAVIQLDVARSFVPSGAGLMLVPHFQLVY